MDAYIWANQQQRSLRKIHCPEDSQSKIIMMCKKEKQQYHFFGVYTPHDNYMGHPYGEALIAFIRLLKKHSIPYELIESAPFSSGEFYMQTNCYVQLNKDAYQQLKRSFIL